MRFIYGRCHSFINGPFNGPKSNGFDRLAQLFRPWSDIDKRGLDLVFRRDDNLKILGVKFDREGGGQGNWKEMIGKVWQRLGFWGLRQLTLEGKKIKLNL